MPFRRRSSSMNTISLLLGPRSFESGRLLALRFCRSEATAYMETLRGTSVMLSPVPAIRKARAMVRINSNALRIAHCWLLGGLFALGVTAQAEEGRFYLGLGAVADAQEFTYGKTVYIPGGLTRNEFTSAEGDADQTLFTLGGFGGYRWPLSANGGLHLGAEIDVAYHPSELKGHLEGTGYTWTDTWPEDWWLKRNYSYGLTLKLGGLLGNSDFGLYALTGLRSVKTEFSITETGCPGPDLQCPPSPLASFTEKVDRRFSARTLGVGLERQLGERFAAQLEVRHTDYKRKSWDRLFDDGAVIIPSTLNGRETSAALRLVRYF